MNNKTSGKYHASVTSSFSKTKGFFNLFFAQQKISQRYPWKTEFFPYDISQKQSANQQNNHAMMLFMSKQVSLPKISLVRQKTKIGPKCYVCPFCMKAFNFYNLG